MEEPKLGHPIFFRVLIVYNFIFAIAMSFLSIAILTDGLDARLRFVFGMAGIFSSLTTYYIGRKDLDKQEKDFDLRMDRRKVEIERLKPVAPATPINTEHVVTLHVPTNNGKDTMTYHRTWTDAERPPQELIEYCWKYMQSHPKRHVPERAVRENPQYAEKAEIYLAAMERVGLFRREDTRPNAARVWANDVSLQNALAIFGYADEVWLPKGESIK